MSAPETGLWVVIPAYNEGEVIAQVVGGVRAQYPCVIVVDDCSNDETGDSALRGGAVVLRHAVNLGQGAALVTGIRHALTGAPPSSLRSMPMDSIGSRTLPFSCSASVKPEPRSWSGAAFSARQ